DQANWRGATGERVAEIGPLPVMGGGHYSLQKKGGTFTTGGDATAPTPGGTAGLETNGGGSRTDATPGGANRARGRATRDCPRGSTDAPDGDWERTAPVACPHPSRIITAANYDDACMGAERAVQQLSLLREGTDPLLY